MKEYIFEDNARKDDKLALCVLVENTDYGHGEYYKQIMGASYDLACIEKMITELETKPDTDENAEYTVYRIKQQYDHIHISEFDITEPLKDSCYIVYRGPVFEIAEELLGYFGNRQHAIQSSEYAISFFETEDIICIKVPLDRLYSLEEIEIGSWDEDEWEFSFD